MSDALLGSRRCACSGPHSPRLVVLTGGPGAGKTAVLEVARRHCCEHVVVLPESASIVYGGGFPRLDALPARRRAQIAILHVQDQMERLELEMGRAALVLCDRGVLDGLAYWPDGSDAYYAELGSSREALLARYTSVIHLRTPGAGHGYDRENRLRTESADQAALLDEKIERAYEGHPSRHFVPSSEGFVEKLRAALALIDAHVPLCCRASATRPSSDAA